MGTRCCLMRSISGLRIDDLRPSWLKIWRPCSRWRSDSLSLLCMSSMHTKSTHVRRGTRGRASTVRIWSSRQAMARLYWYRANEFRFSALRKGVMVVVCTIPSWRLLTARTAWRTAGSDWHIWSTSTLQKAPSRSPDRHGAVMCWKK